MDRPRKSADVASDTLAHEFHHDWEKHTGVPNSFEGRADAFASEAMSIWRQLQAQGGERALAELVR